MLDTKQRPSSGHAQGVKNGIDKIRGTKTVVPKAGTLLVFKLRKA